MKHLVGNIQKRSLGYLEQACERYALMAYEILRRELAIGFRSTTYSYRGHPEDQYVGTFTATLIPWEEADEYRHGHCWTRISFNVCAVPEESWWVLGDGKILNLDGDTIATIRFSEDGRRLALNIPEWDEIRFASGADHSPESVTPLHKEPWGNLKTDHII